jgi:hypothetical protein
MIIGIKMRIVHMTKYHVLTALAAVLPTTARAINGACSCEKPNC